MAGKSLRGLQEGARLLRERGVKKYYAAIVWGHLTEPLSAEGWLVKDEEQNLVRLSEKRQSDHDALIQTKLFPLQVFREHTLLRVELVTGKTHQIRAHLSFLGYPILGDPKYGNREKNREFAKTTPLHRQMLHARELILADGKTFTAPYPSDFSAALEQAGHIS